MVPRGGASASSFSHKEKLDSLADEIRWIAKEHRLDVTIISDIAQRFFQKDNWRNQPEKEFAEARATDMPTEDKKGMHSVGDADIHYDRDRDPDVEYKIVNAPETGKAWIDFDPIWDCTDEMLEALFEEADKKELIRNFVTYVTGPESSSRDKKVRVNCRYHALDTVVKYPPRREGFK